MSEEKSRITVRSREGLPACPCGGETRYFGEALMGSLMCLDCGESLAGEGWEFVTTIRKRWKNGDRGYFETE